MKLALLAIALAACGDRRAENDLPLATYLIRVHGLDEATRRQVTDGWMLDEAEWRRTVVAPFDARHREYVQGFRRGVNELDSMLQVQGEVATRRHFADDPKGSLEEARARWALPVLAEAQVVSIAGFPTGAVFVQLDGRWKMICGIDRIVRRAVDSFDPACGALIDGESTKRCREVAWEVADAALRNQRERVAHACALAKTACGKPAP